ncbi:hypothetical protein KKG46_03060 [Patescibacteria group bacterium]|nr:hypothetical protein [Patescibacteria group bacterium]
MPDELTAPPSSKPASSKRDEVLADIQRIYPKDQYIEFDDSDQAAYIVYDGEVQVVTIVVVDGKNHEIELAILKKGSYLNGHKFFGFVSTHQYKVRFRTLCRVVLIRFTKDKLPDPLKSDNDRQAFSRIFESFLRSSYAEKTSLVQGIIDTHAKTLKQNASAESQAVLDLRSQLAQKESTIQKLESTLIQSSRTTVHDETPDAQKIQALTRAVEEAELRAQHAENLVSRLQRALKRAETNNLKFVRNHEPAIAEAYESLHSELDEARQTQIDLEQTVLDLREKLRKPKQKFSQTEELLKSEALEALEAAEAKRKQVSEYFETMAGRMQRALEIIFLDNPHMVFAEDARLLWLGEEPPPRKSIAEQQRIKRSHTDPNVAAVLDVTQPAQPLDRKTAILGSSPPELARPAKSNKTTDRMQPRDPVVTEDPVTAEIDDLFRGFVLDEDKSDIVNNEFNWEPDDAPRETIPFEPDEEHPALNSNVHIPGPPPSLRSDPDMHTPVCPTNAFEDNEPSTRPSPKPPVVTDRYAQFSDKEPDTHTREILADAQEHPFGQRNKQPVLQKPIEFIPDGVTAPPSSGDMDDYTRPYGIPRPPGIPSSKKT